MAKLVGVVFSGLAALSVEGVEDAGDVIVVRASTRGDEVECPSCGTPTSRVHAFHERIPADVPVDGRRVLVRLRIRRMRRPVTECVRRTFREQVPGLIERYRRRTVRLDEQVRGVVTPRTTGHRVTATSAEPRRALSGGGSVRGQSIHRTSSRSTRRWSSRIR
ncbi:transposase family protein [Saccharothrix luteola]|uniref:transposase family protein n=1 Tax=Saccharothrix luteola TaxID=2893018 RepID=UPI003557F58D